MITPYKAPDHATHRLAPSVPSNVKYSHASSFAHLTLPTILANSNQAFESELKYHHPWRASPSVPSMTGFLQCPLEMASAHLQRSTYHTVI